jgi:hypothetical protein
MRGPLSTLLLAGAAVALAAARALAQGGPPMVTDDPGTPGDHHWEINLSWTDQRTPGSTVLGLPLLDANFGVGDRLQLNYQGSWNELRDPAGTESGLSDSQLALKWRFYDAGDTGLQASIYPRITFLNPGSDSDRRGTADAGTSFLMPFEVRRDFGLLAVDLDAGYTLSDEASLRGWMGGVCVGRDVVKGWEVDLELHATGDHQLGRDETLLNLGTHIDLSEHASILLAIGRDIRDTVGERTSLLTYVGVQLRL